MLRISSISAERWIFIDGEDSVDEPDEFAELVKEYKVQLSGKIKAFSKYSQYIVNNDPLKLIFQWDSLFGITVIVPRKTNINIAEKVLQDLCDRINNKSV